MKISWPYLSPEDALYQRLRSLHDNREADLSSNWKFAEGDIGLLVITLVPEASLMRPRTFDGSELKRGASQLNALGSDSSYGGRFNADGWLIPNGRQGERGYSQIFRDGRFEGVLAGLLHPTRSVFFDRRCEEAVLDGVPAYLRCIRDMGLDLPVWLQSSIIGCQGARFRIAHQFEDLADHAIDRAVISLPMVKLEAFDTDGPSVLRGWCDTLWQAGGVERSLNYDQHGVRKSLRR